MAKRKLQCPECGHTWEYGFWQWTLRAPFHEYVFFLKKDFRKTKCPKCGKKSWIARSE